MVTDCWTIWPSIYNLTELEQKSTWVTPDLIRLSVGLESVTDLKADLEQAFKTI